MHIYVRAQRLQLSGLLGRLDEVLLAPVDHAIQGLIKLLHHVRQLRQAVLEANAQSQRKEVFAHPRHQIMRGNTYIYIWMHK